jgi:hypothetical protein
MSTIGASLPNLLFAFLTLAVPDGPPASQRPADPGLVKNEQAERLRTASPEALIASGREAVRKLGTYRARLVKTERIKGEVRPAQTIDILVRPSPPAIRMEYIAGPKSGRRVIWRQDKRPGEILVREGGILGLTSLWLDSAGSLARGDTNHAVSEIGFANLFDVMERDLAKGKTQGGHTRKDLGLDANGLYWLEWIAPPGAHGLYAQRTRMGIDLNLNVPVDVEVYDAQGLLERYQYKNVRTRQSYTPADFEDL